MTDNRVPSELTPAASELLDQYTERFKRRVLEESRMVQGGEPSSTVRMESVREVLDGIVKARSLPTSRPSTIRWLTLAAVALLVAGLIVGSALFRDVDAQIIFTILVLNFGLVFAFSFTGKWRDWRRAKERLNRQSVITFLRQIEKLEEAARSASRILDADAEAASLSDVLTALEKIGVWNSEDILEFRILLGLRNAIVHESVPAIEPVQLVRASSMTERLMERLARRSRNRNTTTRSARISTSRISLDALTYERRVGEALRRVIGDASVMQTPDSFGYDFIVEMPTGSVEVIVRYREGRQLGLQEVLALLDRTSNKSGPGRLIVTNGALSERIKNFNASSDELSPPAEVVTWNSSAGDDILARCLARLAREGRPATGGRFELYRDANGKYRFRLKAPNGEIIAVGEAFETRAAAIRKIDAVRGAAGGAALFDVS